MVNATTLKKSSAAKGEPPKRGQGIDPIKSNTRKPAGPKRALNLSVSEDLFDRFSEMAGRECGFKKGAKMEFFELLVDHWENTKVDK